MSTFTGVVTEFPDIRIDYFRTISGRVPPLACFLSHVHSDHLQGLESLKAPFVYCSNSTRELLLRIEKYPHRMNFAKGILEARKQHYKHLRLLLKPIPLNVPTEIELKPSQSIRVTLLDANHCPGAVMFLIEDRTEPWWVNAVIRQPGMIPYTHGLRVLDKVYLDTTFAVNQDPYRSFPSKAQGLKELLTEVSKFPEDTIFHFNAWTLGYEDVWVALAAHLNSQIHVDDYKFNLYSSLSSSSSAPATSAEGAALCGFRFGNRSQAGCLTRNDSVKLHSCEHGTKCSTLETSSKVVWITPLITRSKEGNVPELGAGGGGGDLIQTHELELSDPQAGYRLIELCKKQIKDQEVLGSTIRLLEDALISPNRTVDLSPLDQSSRDNAIPLEQFACLLSRMADQKDSSQHGEELTWRLIHRQGPTPVLNAFDDEEEGPSRRIQFPYSRHSSYDELCHLLSVLKPMDVYPCVADEESWAGGATIEGLFGHLCSGTNFSYDEDMRLNHHKFDTPRPLERISSQVPQAGNRDSSPQITNVPNAGFDPGGSFPASHRPQPISANRSEVTPGSATPAKRPSTVGTNPRKRSQKNFTRQEPSAQGADRALGGSFSGWLEPSDEPVLSKRPVSVSAADEIDREAAARDVYPPPCLPKANRAEPAEDEHYDATASSMPAGKSTSEPRPTDGGGGGTQLRPIELLSDPSESESDDTTSDAVESSPPEARRYDNNSIHPTTSGSETQLSASASAFDDESQELGQSSPVKGAGSGSGSGQARMQQRREIYERVRHDDGFGWGREYGLFSTATRYEDDDGGADGSQEL